jgi:hypothetical protein
LIGLVLAGARSWRFLTRVFRTFLADYAVPISILIFVVLNVTVLSSAKLMLPSLNVSTTYGSTNDLIPYTFVSLFVQPLDIPTWAIFAAIIPGFVLTILIFFDHNVSAMLAQRPELELKKPSAYNYDFFVVGLSMFVCSAFGLPFAHGLIPQAPLHAIALTLTHKDSHHHNEKQNILSSDMSPKVLETRLTNFGQSLLIGLTLAPPVVRMMGYLPSAVLAGIFLYLGIESFQGNQFFTRIVGCFLADSTSRYHLFQNLPRLSEIPWRFTALFTALQLLFLIVIGIVTEFGGPASIAFPLFIIGLIPIRQGLFPRWFSLDHLLILDSWSVEAPSKDDDVELPELL